METSAALSCIHTDTSEWDTRFTDAFSCILVVVSVVVVVVVAAAAAAAAAVVVVVLLYS